MIVVTGASKGLGAAICERLVGVGHEVYGLARDVNNLEYDGQSCDVTSYEDIRAVARHLKQKKAEIHGLVNSAGVASLNLALTTPPGVTENIINTNLLGTIFCCQVFAPIMIRQKQGSIINFSSLAVKLGLMGESVYAASKAGIETFSRVFAKEVSAFGIRVNCISPGPIATDLLKNVGREEIERTISGQIIRRQFEPSDVCDLVEFLLESKSSSLSGQVLRVGGA